MIQSPAAIFRLWYTGTDESLQAALLALREAGYSQMDSLKCLIDQLGLSLREADAIVLNAEAWWDVRQRNLRFRDELGNTLNDPGGDDSIGK